MLLFARVSFILPSLVLMNKGSNPSVRHCTHSMCIVGLRAALRNCGGRIWVRKMRIHHRSSETQSSNNLVMASTDGASAEYLTQQLERTRRCRFNLPDDKANINHAPWSSFCTLVLVQLVLRNQVKPTHIQRRPCRVSAVCLCCLNHTHEIWNDLFYEFN